MEDALAQDPKAVKAKDSGVLILVLMEDALAQRPKIQVARNNYKS